MVEQNCLDTLVALRILIEALRPEGTGIPPGDQAWEKQPDLAGINRRNNRQAKGGVRLGGGSR